ncbi:MAG: hypothetical protein ACSHXD_20295 [Marinosulfonomonas sp.]
MKNINKRPALRNVLFAEWLESRFPKAREMEGMTLRMLEVSFTAGWEARNAATEYDLDEKF